MGCGTGPLGSSSVNRGCDDEEGHRLTGLGGSVDAHDAHGGRGARHTWGWRRSLDLLDAFGTLPSPCGKGHDTGATDTGVTNSTINIAYGDDRGFSGLPGLDQEMGDAVKAMIAWCNAQGGIGGRKIVGDYGNAAVTNVGSVMTQECKQDFMLVGEGFALDGTAEQTRLGCNLAAVPGFTVSPVVANAYEMYQASPNPANASPVSSAYEAEKLFGSKTKKVGVYDSTLSTQESSTAKAVQAFTTAGWKFLPNCTASIDYNGEANYTPFMQKLQSCGAQIIFNDATPGPTLYGAFEAENQIGYDPIWIMDSGAYTAAFAQWNTEGLANNAYVRLSYEPLEAAKVVPAVSQYLSIVKKYGGLTSQLGEQATSSFLLWATEAKACGSTLTRQCMINHLAKVTNWTGGGLNASGNPAKNLPPNCGAPDEARRDEVGPGLPEEARDVRLLLEVRRRPTRDP